MSTRHLGLSNTNNVGSYVDPLESNLVHNVIDTQVYGGLRAIGTGIIQNADGDSLLVVQNDDLSISVNAGSGIIWSDETNTGRESASVVGRLENPVDKIVPPYSTSFIHAVLKKASIFGAPNSEEGTADVTIVVSNNDSVPGGLWLSTVVAESSIISVTPSNLFVKADEALLRLIQVESDINYDSAARLKGTIASRLNTLESTGEENPGEENPDPSYGQLVLKVQALETTVAVLVKRIEELGGPIDGLVRASDKFINRDVARLEVIAVEQNAANSMRIDGSVVIPGTAGNGEVLGIDEFGTTVVTRDVHSGNTEYDVVKGEER